jgi:integrin-linked kinase
VNILPVLGACVSLPDLIIVSQFMHYGSLYNVLHEQSDLIIDLNQATSFAIHIAKG